MPSSRKYKNNVMVSPETTGSTASASAAPPPPPPPAYCTNSERRTTRGLETDTKNVEEQETKRLRLLYPAANTELSKLLRIISSNNEDDVNNALSQLDGIFRTETKNEGTTITFIRHGGQAILMNAMKKHFNSARIQNNISFLIMRLCYDRELIDLEEIGGLNGIKISFGSLGALDSLKQAVEEFPNNEILNVNIMGALNDLLIPSLSNLPLLHPFQVFLNMIVTIMKKFPTNENMQTCGCQILNYTVGKIHNSKTVFREAGALSIAVSVMEQYRDDSWAYKNAWRFMAEYMKHE